MTNFYEQLVEKEPLESLVQSTSLPKGEKDVCIEDNDSQKQQIVLLKFNSQTPEISDLVSPDIFKLQGSFPEMTTELFNCLSSGSSFPRTFYVLSNLTEFLKQAKINVKSSNTGLIDSLKSASKDYLSMMSRRDPARNFDIGDNVKIVYNLQNSLNSNFGWSFQPDKGPLRNMRLTYLKERNTAFPIGSHGIIMDFNNDGVSVKINNVKPFNWYTEKYKGTHAAEPIKREMGYYDQKELAFVPISPLNANIFNSKLELFTALLFGMSSQVYNIREGYEEFISRKEGYQKNRIPRDITDKLKPTKQEILEFSRLLSSHDFQEKPSTYAANYLTALMHSSKSTDFEIDFSNSKIRLPDIAYLLNNKTLKICGSVGTNLGLYAKDCNIYLDGSCETIAANNVGEGTKIYIKDCANWRQVYPEQKVDITGID